jgi:ABC-type transporter Mla subunit MlaD
MRTCLINITAGELPHGNAADDIIAVLDNASTTATTVVDNASALDALLLNTIGFAQGGVDLIAPNQQNLADAINNLEPTTALLLKYSPMVTCSANRPDPFARTHINACDAALAELLRIGKAQNKRLHCLSLLA